MAWQGPLVAELNSFFLINVFKLPRTHWFNFMRVFLLLLAACPATMEWYWYINNKSSRIGHHAWLMFMTVLVELFLCVRYSVDLNVFESYWPPREVLIPWLAFGALYGFYFLVHCWRYYRLGQGRPTAFMAFGFQMRRLHPAP